MKITILGTGAYGLSLALMFSENKSNEITLWSKFKDETDYLEKNNKHEKFLPGINFPDDFKYTCDMKEAVKDAKIIVIATPTKFVDATCKELAPLFKSGTHICIASKGIDQDSCLFGNEILARHISTQKVCAISGPSFAVDIADYQPIGLALGYSHRATADIMLEALQGKTLKLHATRDILGVEVCGAIKNVMAIASGILSGLGVSESTNAMFLTEALHDIKRLIIQLGGRKSTVISLAGVGDLILTCTCVKSRNFSFGKLIGEKASKEEIESYISATTIEGLYTLTSVRNLAKKKKLSVPIVDVLNDIIYNDKEPEALIDFLLKKEE